eukprot:SAG31_NODE_3998_length_3677_cov_10.286193_3_plen_63_part_00
MIVKKLVKLFDTEGDNANKVQELLEEMHKCGQPPKEIMDKLSRDGAGALGGVDPAAENCSIM